MSDENPAERLAKMPNHACGRCASEYGGLRSSERCICGPNVPCGHCGQGMHPMTPAVPDPTVEAPEITVAIKAQNPDLETAWRTIAWWEQTCDYWYEQTKDARARAAAPDALRVKAETLAAEQKWFETAYGNALDKGFTKQYLDGFKSALGWVTLHAGMARDAAKSAAGGGGVESVAPPD